RQACRVRRKGGQAASHDTARSSRATTRFNTLAEPLSGRFARYQGRKFDASNTGESSMMKISSSSMFGGNLVLSAFLLGSAGPVSATDGQIVINQSKAQAGNVTPGDAAGFPVTISRSGSYVLSGNLTVPRDKSGIQIAADDVTLDLNGFRIKGSGSGGNGIGPAPGPDLIPPFPDGVTIRNGTIANFGIAINLHMSVRTVVHQVRAFDNDFGISLGPVSVVSGSVASGNRFGFGIEVGGGTLVSGNSATHNAGSGLHVDCPSNIVGNTAHSNAEMDIRESGAGCTRTDNNPAP
ncbi:MAG: right-handed parallel beta-helix repeat-containing protein, partial [Steroidobacteraceae bacterium]